MFTTLQENCSQFSFSLRLSSFTLLPFSLPFRDVWDVWDGMGCVGWDGMITNEEEMSLYRKIITTISIV